MEITKDTSLNDAITAATAAVYEAARIAEKIEAAGLMGGSGEWCAQSAAMYIEAVILYRWHDRAAVDDYLVNRSATGGERLRRMMTV